MKRTNWLLISCLLIILNACEQDSNNGSTNHSDNNSEQIEKENTPPTEEAKAETTEATRTEDMTLDDKIAFIKTQYKNIQANTSKYQTKSMEIEDGFTMLKGFFDNGSLVKIEREFAQGHGALISSYYIKDNKLFFILQAIHGEESLHGPFTTEQNRFYIWDNNIIRHLQKKIRTVGDETFNIDTIPNVDRTADLKRNDLLIDPIENYEVARKAFKQ